MKYLNSLLYPFLFSLPCIGHSFDVSNENAIEPAVRKYTLGIIPAAAYDSDLGIKYGAVVNIFDYRNKTNKTGYDQHLFLRFTNTTKGSLQLQGLLESSVLFRNSVTTIEAGYISDKKYDFYGFNGLQTLYRPELTDPSDDQFRNRFYYSYERVLLRLRLYNQLVLGSSNFRLLTGVTLNNYKIPSPENSVAPSQTQFPENSSLFEKYTDWVIISNGEKSGGRTNTMSIGVVYDTRNDLCYCTDGIWAEAVLLYSPDIINKNPFTRLVLTYRHHSSFLQDKLTLSFRVSSQHHTGGNPPFYSLSTYYDSRLSQDGLGGAFNLRGANRNRIVAKGFLVNTIEPKLKILDFNLFRQHFFISTSLFYDNALVTQNYGKGSGSVPADSEEFYSRETRQSFHHTTGAGAYIVINKDNIITINYGFPLNNQNGNGGLYVGSSLLF